MRGILLILMILYSAVPDAGAAQQDVPPTGFLWKRTPLPATLPLQVTSPSGADYVVVLTAPDTDAPAMAGFLRGGDVLRLRVPPGDWQVSIGTGSEWQGNDALFGAEAEWDIWPERLHFSAGEAALHGHAIEIANVDGTPRITGVGAQVICQLPATSRGPTVRPLRTEPLTRYDPLLKRDDVTWSSPLLKRDNGDRLNFAKPEQRPDDRVGLQMDKLRETTERAPTRSQTTQAAPVPCE